MNRSRILAITLGLMLFTQGCFPAQPQTVPQLVDESPQTTEEVESADLALETEAPLPTATPVPTTEASPTPEAVVSVNIRAVNGNLYIRRGPSTRYNRIGILKSSMTAKVIGQDVLSKWVQITLPDSELTGWVSLQTPFSQVEGNLEGVPAFTFTEWPEPAYIKNCTEHDMFVAPIGISLYSLWTNSKYLNEEQVDPGTYEIYDLFVPGEPLVETIDVQEGETYYLTLNGLGVTHNCP